MGGPRGRLTDLGHRRSTLKLINNAMGSGARLTAVCDILKISPRTIQRWRHQTAGGDRRKKAAAKRVPANKLTQSERGKILQICNQAEFANMAPNQIVPTLADQGSYVASESSFYRILRQEKQLVRRGRAKAPGHKRPDAIEATGANQLWSWDITYLPSTVRGLFFYLYMIMDVYSRKIVGWEVFGTESSENAALLIRKTCLKEKVSGSPLILHSDNGSPMKGATMLATLQKLGVIPSFSRPSVSNDNAYSEALFKTLKYHPGYPDSAFDDIDGARQWVLKFVHWYNEIHHHSAIKFVTPGQRHRGEDIDILQRRDELYCRAKSRHPERWSGITRNWTLIQVVSLNPNKKLKQMSRAA